MLYCNGTNVIWRSVDSLAKGEEKPDDVLCWKGHTRRTTAAAMAPNGQWVVSGDVAGAVKVWGAKGERVQKNEYKLWDGTVRDVSWSEDSTRIVACGDGKEVRAVAMIWDTGSKTGEVAGHTKKVNSISFRSQRPFRVVTGGEDMLVAFHQGPPFKFAKSHTVHSNFVNAVRYSPDGNWVVSAGSDSKLCLYEGKDGELVKEFAKPDGISGSLWAAAWSPDSARVVTAGGDKRLRVWDRESGTQVGDASIGEGVLEDMQVGVVWPKADRIISVCLDGRLLFWDVAPSGSLALATSVDGTQGPLTCLASDAKSGAFIYGGSDGFVALTKPDKGTVKAKIGKSISHVLAHSAAYEGPPEAFAFALDDCAHRLSPETGALLGKVEIKEFAAGAVWLDAAETKMLVVTTKQNFHCVSAGAIEWSKPGAVPRKPTAVASAPGSPGFLAVAIDKPEGSAGGVQSSLFQILIFAVESSAADGLVQKATLDKHLGEVCSLRFSPGGQRLASGDASNKVLVWDLRSGEAQLEISDWSFHTARVTCLDWLSGDKLVTGSLDRHMFLFDATQPSTKVQLLEVHKAGVAAVAASGSTFASVGHDGFLHIHQLG